VVSGYLTVKKKFDDVFSRFHRIPACDKWREYAIAYSALASRSKKSDGPFTANLNWFTRKVALALTL